MKCNCGYSTPDNAGKTDAPIENPFIELDAKITRETGDYYSRRQQDVSLVACPECGAVYVLGWEFPKQKC